MKRTTFIKTGLLALVLTVTGCNIMPQKTASAKTRVVFQVSDNDTGKWNLALNNAKNVQQELGADKVEIEIVAYGPGIGMLKADAVTNSRVMEATKSGIKVVACENTMNVQKLTRADMNPVISYVPAGVVELMRLHSEGWAYIRP
jgi:uncharacterized protein